MNEYVIQDDFAYIIICSKKNGEFRVKIDLLDLEKCKEHHWGISGCRKIPYKYKYYVYTYEGRNHLMLHRFLMQPKADEIIDHINRDTLDNTRNNLQICNISTNEMNSDISINNASGCKGVMWCDKLKTPKYKAYIMIKRKYIHLGYFDSYNDAVIARECAEKEYFLSENKLRKEI